MRLNYAFKRIEEEGLRSNQAILRGPGNPALY